MNYSNTLLKPPCCNGTPADMEPQQYLINQLKHTAELLEGSRKHFSIGDECVNGCFTYTLVELQGIVGWHLTANKGYINFANSAVYLGYPVISCAGTFENYSDFVLDISGMHTENVLNMAHMFHFCDVPRIDLSRLNTQHCLDAEYLIAESTVETIVLNKSTFMLNNPNTAGLLSLFSENRSIVVVLTDDRDKLIDCVFFANYISRKSFMDELDEHLFIDKTSTMFSDYCIQRLGIDETTTYEYIGHLPAPQTQKSYSTIESIAKLANAVLVKVEL